MAWKRPFFFVVVGLVAIAVSISSYTMFLSLGVPLRWATVLRELVAYPILIIGYPRLMLRDVYLTELREIGWWRTQLRMTMRVLASSGVNSLAKIAIEPLLAQIALSHGHPEWVRWVPFLGDFGYGPIIAYSALTLSTRFTLTQPKASKSIPPAPSLPIDHPG